MQRIIKLTGLVFFVLSSNACDTSDKNTTGDKDRDKSDTNRKISQTTSSLEQKIQELSADLKDDPNQPDKQIELAKAYTKQDNHLQARRTLEAALELDSSNARYHYWYGKVYWNLDAAKQAINQTKKALAFNPGMKDAHLALGKYYFYVKKRKKSFKHLNEALRQDELIAEAYLYKGLNYKEMGDTGDAISNLQTVTEIKPKNYKAHLHLGNLHLDQPKKALDYYQNAVKLKPKNISARYSRGYTYQQLKQYEQAKKDYKRLLEIKPYHQQGNYNLGYLQYLDTNCRKAIKNFKRVIAKDSNHVRAHLGKGLCLKELDKNAKARKHLQKVVDITPQNRLAREALKELEEDTDK